MRSLARPAAVLWLNPLAVTLAMSLSIGACGGKTVLLTGSDEDGGALGRPPTADAGRDSAAPALDGGENCPPRSEVVSLDGPCEWSGTCTVDLDGCDTGQGTPLACTCIDNVIALPPGTGISCTHSTVGACPAGLIIGGACTGTTVCATDYCGPGDTTTCTCQEGVWTCPGVDCLPPTQACVNGAACTIGVNCDDPTGCDTDCSCIDGFFQCTTDCGGSTDAGAGP